MSTQEPVQLDIVPSRGFIFWQRWLFFTSLLFALSGIILSVYGKNLFFLPYDKMLANVFWHQPEFPLQADAFRAFIYGPLGGTITCCYILVAFIAWYPFKERKRWARSAIITAFSIWVTIDSAICWYYGIYPQIYVINAFSITVKVLPLIFTWKDFK